MKIFQKKEKKLKPAAWEMYVGFDKEMKRLDSTLMKIFQKKEKKMKPAAWAKYVGIDTEMKRLDSTLARGSTMAAVGGRFVAHSKTMRTRMLAYYSGGRTQGMVLTGGRSATTSSAPAQQQQLLTREEGDETKQSAKWM